MRCTRILGIALLCAIESACGTETPKAIYLRPGSLGTDVCEWKYKKLGICFNGYSVLAGCEEECAIAVISGSHALQLAFPVVVTGTVIDGITHKPLEGCEIHLVFPNQERFAVRANAEGDFRFTITPDVKLEKESYEPTEYKVGPLSTSSAASLGEEPEAIAILMSLTDAFRAEHSELKYVSVRASEISGVPISADK